MVDVCDVAALLADRSRARICAMLLAGRAYTAGELARAAGIAPSTASEHLARLVDGGLVSVHAAGRHRYHRLAGPQVAAALEALSLLTEPAAEPVRTLRADRRARALAQARTCYDHLAGRLGVGLYDGLVAGGLLLAGDGLALSAAGERWCAEIGIDLAAVRAARRPVLLPCVDWTERRTHLAGGLGAALCGRLLALGWVHRVGTDRAVRLSDAGRAGLAAVLEAAVLEAAVPEAAAAEPVHAAAG
jgi:DNA-binding transcriptional ArsR family regulator